MNDIYAYVFKGFLTSEDLYKKNYSNKYIHDELASNDLINRLCINDFSEEYIERARKMAIVYIAISSLENTIRDFVQNVLKENKGEIWWEASVSSAIKKKSENRRSDEEKIKWHSSRGMDLIYYTEFGDLVTIMANNWEYFEDHVVSQDWARHIIKSIEKSRNVIMHSGELSNTDIERVGTLIRDWISQVGV